MALDIDGPADAVAEAVMTAAQLLETISVECLAAVDASITVPQFRVLLTLSSHGAANLATLAKVLDVQPSTIGRMIERLVAAGLIDRRNHPTSRRELIVDLNTQGRKVVENVISLRREQFTRLVQMIPSRLQQDLIDGLTALSEAGSKFPPTEFTNEFPR